MSAPLSRLARMSLLAFAARVGLTLYPWQADAFGEATRREAGRFVHRIAGISVPRGNGKSLAGAAVGVWRLFAGPQPQHVLSAALDVDGAKVVMQHARAIIRSHPTLDRACEIKASTIAMPETGSRWEVTSREHTASRGRHPHVVIYDEIGWARDDELFASLLAGQASVDDPFCLVISTVGRRQAGPLWIVKQLADGADPAVFWWWSGENLSPKVTAQFLERQRRILLPAQFAREHQNAWVDAADSFVTSEDVDAAMGHGWTEQAGGQSGVRYMHAWDLGLVHDPTVGGVGHVEDGRLVLDTLLTLQGSKREPVQLRAVEAAMCRLAAAFPPARIRVESWQGMSAAQALARIGLPVELFTPTAKAHAEEWPVLAQRFAGGTIVLPPHARLRDELLNLVTELTPTGVRVVDRGRVHQDHAVVLRMLAAMLAPGRAWTATQLEGFSNSVDALRRPSDWPRQEAGGFQWRK